MTPKSPMFPARRRRIVIWLLAFFGVGFWLFPYAYHRGARVTFEAYQAELAVKGESLEVDALRPPPIENPDDDVAAAPIFADSSPAVYRILTKMRKMIRFGVRLTRGRFRGFYRAIFNAWKIRCAT